MISILVPDLGDGIDKVEVALWHKKAGEGIDQDEDVVELVTDKASFHVPAPRAGILRKICVPAGEEVPIGTVLGEME